MDVEEWKFYKNAFKLKSPIEQNLFNVEENGTITILLHELESICLPLKLDFLKMESFTSQQDFTINSEIKVIISNFCHHL